MYYLLILAFDCSKIAKCNTYLCVCSSNSNVVLFKLSTKQSIVMGIIIMLEQSVVYYKLPPKLLVGEWLKIIYENILFFITGLSDSYEIIYRVLHLLFHLYIKFNI